MLRKIIFWCHLTAGVAAGAVIFIMASTGAIMMFESEIVAFAERGARGAPAPPGAERLSLDLLMDKARAAYPDARPTGLTLRAGREASVAFNFGREGVVYVHPYTGEALGRGSGIRDWFNAVEDWHRWLGAAGEGRAAARAVTGACNLAFLTLAVSGVYLWGPLTWSRTTVKLKLYFNRHARGHARRWNWHNVIGFWCSAVLIVLTLTAAVMSYPWANDLLYTLTGSEPPPRPQAAESAGARRGQGAGRARAEKPLASLDVFPARAEQYAPGWISIFMRFAPRPDGPVTLSIVEPAAPHPFARSQLTVDRHTGATVKWEPFSGNSTGRKLRSWARALHTGEAFGVAGQLVAGTASLGGCFLVYTGLAMAWRRLRARGVARRGALDLTSDVE